MHPFFLLRCEVFRGAAGGDVAAYVTSERMDHAMNAARVGRGRVDGDGRGGLPLPSRCQLTVTLADGGSPRISLTSACRRVLQIRPVNTVVRCRTVTSTCCPAAPPTRSFSAAAAAAAIAPTPRRPELVGPWSAKLASLPQRRCVHREVLDTADRVCHLTSQCGCTGPFPLPAARAEVMMRTQSHVPVWHGGRGCGVGVVTTQQALSLV